jgi:hypothetical protein
MPDYNQSVSEIATSPVNPAGSGWVPIFPTANYAKRPSMRCNLCSNSIFSEYYKVNGQKTCATCADQARMGISTESRGSLVGALICGVAGAAIAMVLYALVMMSSGVTIGYLSLFVGWIVGKSVMTGARNVGSARVQYLAALLTYAAITLDELPRLAWSLYTHPSTLASLSTVLPPIILAGLASPVTRFQTDPVNGGIHLVILLIGLGIAWRLTKVKPHYVAGPFNMTASK